jgi:hypothetical protein
MKIHEQITPKTWVSKVYNLARISMVCGIVMIFLPTSIGPWDGLLSYVSGILIGFALGVDMAIKVPHDE